MKPKVVCVSLLVAPRPAQQGDEPWDDDSFGCAIEGAVDEFQKRLGRHGLKLLDYANGGDPEDYAYVDHDETRRYPSRHSLLKVPEPITARIDFGMGFMLCEVKDPEQLRVGRRTTVNKVGVAYFVEVEFTRGPFHTENSEGTKSDPLWSATIVEEEKRA